MGAISPFCSSFCVLFLDVGELLVLDFDLVLGLLGGARDPSGKGPKDVGSIRRKGGGGGSSLNDWYDVGMVEVGSPFSKFAVVWGYGESHLCHLSLVDSNAPKIEYFDMGINIALVKTLFPIVLMYVLLLSHSACKDEDKGVEEVHCEDCIVEKRGGKETP